MNILLHVFYNILSLADKISYTRRQGLTRQPEPNTGATMNQQRTNGSPSPSPTGYSQPTSSLNPSTPFSVPADPNSDNNSNGGEKQIKSDSRFFFQEKYSKLGVKGNFMPLAAQPPNADLADWLAHQSE